MLLKVKKLKEDAKIPVYSTEGAAGLDIFSAEEIEIPPGEWRVVGTGISIELPEGFEAQVRPRSGLALKGITVLNTPGTIDPDYRGEVKVILFNVSNKSFKVEKGMRIAQLVISKFERVKVEITDSLSDTKRGEGGFGSTGIF
jgi:dUTP pyrophosphatase